MAQIYDPVKRQSCCERFQPTCFRPTSVARDGRCATCQSGSQVILRTLKPDQPVISRCVSSLRIRWRGGATGVLDLTLLQIKAQYRIPLRVQPQLARGAELETHAILIFIPERPSPAAPKSPASLCSPSCRFISPRALLARNWSATHRLVAQPVLPDNRPIWAGR